MAALPEPNHTTLARIYDAIKAAAESEEEIRSHLGASLIGRRCNRQLWLTFRWAEKKIFDGRMHRLFGTGHREEARIVEDLRRAGMEVHDTDGSGEQFRVSGIGGHFGGSMDGAVRGIPEAPKTWHVLECKTSNEKSFLKMKADGVKAAKPEHYAQMQTYMGYTGMDRAFYVMVNKNTDELYTERVEFDPDAFDKFVAKAQNVIAAAEPPPPISRDPSWYECKMCDFRTLCHGDDVPQVNCRTCAHSTPELDGDARWSCDRHAKDLSVDQQVAGCGSHRYIPALLGRLGELMRAENCEVEYQTKDGTKFVNGCGPGAFSSAEIREAGPSVGHKTVHALKAAFGATAVADIGP